MYFCLTRVVKMVDNIKSVFSIKDLENLSGIKAHTIRIWEKRYQVLSPMRTGTNIRYYDTTALQKLLNIALLHRHGYKISKISRLPDSRVPEMVAEIMSKKNVGIHAVSAFKMAMMNFDAAFFYRTYAQLLEEKPLHDVFYEVIIPLMEEIGLLWQTGTISPAHEHFISHLVRQKIMAGTESLLLRSGQQHRTFVLFLPEGEVHEIGLLYLNYELVRAGCKTIYLGSHMPSRTLREIKRFCESPVFVSYFTVAPMPEKVQEHVRELASFVLGDNAELWLLGRNTAGLDVSVLPMDVKLFDSIPKVVREI